MSEAAEARVAADLERARDACLEADRFAEIAISAAWNAYRELKFSQRELSHAGEKARDRAERAHEYLGQVRGDLSNAIFEIEKVIGKKQ